MARKSVRKRRVVKDDFSYELQHYITEQQRIAGEANYADYKPTYQSELDAIEKESNLLYANGLLAMKKITDADRKRCKKLMAHELRREVYDYEMKELRTCYIDGKRVLVPRYISYIEKVRKLKKALA